MLSAFYHWVWCELWICHLWPLLCWGRFPLYPLSENFIFNHKWIKCLEINLPKEAKDLYSENYEDDINRCKDILCSWIGKINIVKIIILPKAVYRFKQSLSNHQGFPDGTVVKNLPTNAGDTRDVSLIPGLGRSPRVGNGNHLQYSCLQNSHGQRSLAGNIPRGCKESRHDGRLSTNQITSGTLHRTGTKNF